MSYTKDEQGNVVRQSNWERFTAWFLKKDKTEPVPDQAEVVLNAVGSNQVAIVEMYHELVRHREELAEVASYDAQMEALRERMTELEQKKKKAKK